METRPSDDLPSAAWVIDPVFGRQVRVPDRAFRKIAASHHDVAHLSRRDLLIAIASADISLPDPERPQRQRYFHAGMGPSRWICVVVEYDRLGRGEAFNAFACRRIPGRSR